MGLNLNAHQFNIERNLFEFAPVANFVDSKDLFDFDVPSIRLHSKYYQLLIDSLGLKFKEDVYKSGMYDFSLEEVLDVFFKLDTATADDYSLTTEQLKMFKNFFYTCLKHKYLVSIS